MDIKISLLLTLIFGMEICDLAVGKTDVFVDDRSTFIFVCPFKADPSKSIKWNGPPNLSVTLFFGLDINPRLPDELASRLSITGDVSSGEYNLRITNIQQSDEGGYRCSGLSGGSPLEEDFNLFIRVAPSNNPTISTDPSGTILAGQTIKLICTIPDGKPLAVITWECTGSGQPESISNSSTAISTVQLDVNKNDNGKICKCIGNHTLWTSPRPATITMDVKYIPDDNLSIQQSPAGGIVRDNEIKLTCSVTGGNPLATLTWDCNGTTTNETTGNIASYSVTFTLYKSDNNRVCTCSATHVVISYKPSVKHTLHVYYEPTADPKISQTPPGYIISNSNVVLTCEVSGGNPLATLSWNCTGTSTNNTSVQKASYSVDLTVDRTFNNKICACFASHRIESYSPIVRHLLVVYYKPDNNPVIEQEPAGVIYAGKKVTLRCTVSGGNPLATLSWNCQGNNTNNTVGIEASYSVKITVDKAFNDRVCTCTASHPVPSYRPSVQHKLIVFYVPEGHVTIQQIPEHGIINHKKVKLICSVLGGNPLAILSWDCKGNTTNLSNASSSSYSVEFKVGKNDNDRFCTCTATHNISSYGAQQKQKLVVYYAPDNIPTIQQKPTGGIVNGTSVILTCGVSGGNPLAILVWNCTGTKINETTETNASYSISFYVNEKDNKKICTCATEHPDKSNLHTIHHVLVVLFGPGFPRLVSEPEMPWFEGNNTRLKCIYDEGNPVATIEWKRENNVQKDESNPILDLVGVSKNDSNASIICVVFNDYGTVESSALYLDIEYLPRIELENQNVTTIEGENFTVSCSATGNPSPNLSWTRKSKLFGEETLGESVLSIENIDRHQDGSYTCTAKSKSLKYGQLISKTEILVVVYFAPDVTVSKDLSEISEDEEITLSCNANGKPTNYTYGWKHQFGGNDIRYFRSATRTLTLSSLSYQDVGQYVCFVNNGIKDLDGTLNQTNHTILELLFTPVFIVYDEVTTGKSGNHVTSAVEFIAYPDIKKSVQWRNATANSVLVNNSNMFMTLERKPVQVNLYGISVSFDKYGYRSSLHFPNFEEKHDGFYNLMINNSVGVNDISIRVVLSERPKPPTHFSASVVGSTEVTLTWIEGFNGGNNQSFVLTYWKLHSEDTKDVMIPEKDGKYYEFDISDLMPSTTYIFTINATNDEGYADPVNNTIVLSTNDISVLGSSIIGPVGGAVGGISAAALIVLSIIVFLRKRQAASAKKTDRKNLTFTSTDEGDEDEGLKDNVLYESAGANFKVNSGPSGDVYAVVTKAKGIENENGQTQETSLYAEIKKKMVQTNAGEVLTNTGKKSTGKHNKKGKFKEQKDRHDDVYENITKQKTTKTPTNTNKDGLVYADLVFKDDGKRHFIIRGIENKTDYADIDLDLKADPLPSDDSDKDEDTVGKEEK